MADEGACASNIGVTIGDFATTKIDGLFSPPRSLARSRAIIDLERSIP